MNKKKMPLMEEDGDELVFDEPIIEPTTIELPVEEPVPDEIITNAYSSSLSDLVRQFWDINNTAKGIITMLETEETSFDKDGVKTLLNKLIDDSTVSIGMITKAIELVDGKQTELMNQGIEKAEEVLSEVPSSEITECKHKKVLKEEDGELSTFDKYWIDEIENVVSNIYDDPDCNEEFIAFWDGLSEDEQREFEGQVVSDISNSDVLWQSVNDYLEDSIRFVYKNWLNERNTLDGTVGEELNSEPTENKDGKLVLNEEEDCIIFKSGTPDSIFTGPYKDESWYTKYWMMEVLCSMEDSINNFDPDYMDEEDNPEVLTYLSNEQIEKLCYKYADKISDMEYLWEDIYNALHDVVDDAVAEAKELVSLDSEVNPMEPEDETEEKENSEENK